MKLVKILFILLFVAVIGGLIYFSITDTPVKQQDVEKNIPFEDITE